MNHLKLSFGAIMFTAVRRNDNILVTCTHLGTYIYFFIMISDYTLEEILQMWKSFLWPWDRDIKMTWLGYASLLSDFIFVWDLFKIATCFVSYVSPVKGVNMCSWTEEREAVLAFLRTEDLPSKNKLCFHVQTNISPWLLGVYLDYWILYQRRPINNYFYLIII